MNRETRRGILAIMFPEFQVRAIDILAFQNTVLRPGGHQRSPLDQCMKGLPFLPLQIFLHCSVSGPCPWLVIRGSCLSMKQLDHARRDTLPPTSLLSNSDLHKPIS